MCNCTHSKFTFNEVSSQIQAQKFAKAAIGAAIELAHKWSLDEGQYTCDLQQQLQSIQFATHYCNGAIVQGEAKLIAVGVWNEPRSLRHSPQYHLIAKLKGIFETLGIVCEWSTRGLICGNKDCRGYAPTWSNDKLEKYEFPIYIPTLESHICPTCIRADVIPYIHALLCSEDDHQKIDWLDIDFSSHGFELYNGGAKEEMDNYYKVSAALIKPLRKEWGERFILQATKGEHGESMVRAWIPAED